MIRAGVLALAAVTAVGCLGVAAENAPAGRRAKDVRCAVDEEPGLTTAAEDPPCGTLRRFLYAGDSRRTGIGVPVAFEIDAALPKLKKQGIMRGLRTVTGSGRVVFSQLHFVGDDLIKTGVINRFLTAQADQRPQTHDYRISAANYRFYYQGTTSYNDRTALVFRVAPKKKRLGLFKGELWIDGETALPLREWGEFVKSPSLFVSRVYFVRDYFLTGVESQPRRIIVKLRTAIAGTADLTMWFDSASNAH